MPGRICGTHDSCGVQAGASEERKAVMFRDIENAEFRCGPNRRRHIDKARLKHQQKNSTPLSTVQKLAKFKDKSEGVTCAMQLK